jgi:hypothetical protein
MTDIDPAPTVDALPEHGRAGPRRRWVLADAVLLAAAAVSVGLG